MALALPVSVKPMGARRGKRNPFPPRAVSPSGNQVISEPAMIVGRSGRVYGRLAERGKPEIVRIQPVDRAYAPVAERGAIQRYVTGGELLALGYDPNDPAVQEAIKSGRLNFGTAAADVANTIGTTTAPATLNTPGAASTAGSAAQRQHQAQQDVFAATQNQINASAAVTAATAGTLGAQQNAINASQAAIQEQDKAAAATKAYLDQQARNNQLAQQENAALESARLNVADKTAIARAERARQATDYLYGLGGLNVPIGIDTPNGADVSGLPPGVRANLKTQEQLVTEANARAETARGFPTEAARLAAAQASNTAETAGNKAQLADIQTRAAQLGVSVANLTLDQARLQVAQAALNLDISQQGPAGTVYNAFSGEFVTPQENAVINAQNGVVVDPTDPTGQTLVSREQLAQRTLPDGNVYDSNGVITDPNIPFNKFINGVWTDTRNGNTFDGTAWHDTNGNVYLNGIWLPDVGWQNIGGTWWTIATAPGAVSPGSYQLLSDGTLRNPQTGERVRYDGQKWVNITPESAGSTNADLSGLFGP